MRSCTRLVPDSAPGGSASDPQVSLARQGHIVNRNTVKMDDLILTFDLASAGAPMET